MEAQCICLSLVYSSHVDQVREYMENDKDKALCNLKKELISTQEEKIKELQKIHQLELQNVKTQETDTKKIKQLEEQIQELENFICFMHKQLKETEENHRAEIYSLQEKLQAISETTVDPSISVYSIVIKESDVQKSVVHLGSCLKKNIDHAIEFSKECGMKQETNMVKLLEKQYQERLEEEIAKDIVSMSIAFAQQTELSRLSKGKENTMSSKQALTSCQQNEKHYFNEMKLSQDQIDLQTSDALDMKFKEEFKPLSKELGEDGEVLLPNSDHLDDIVESEVHQLTISEEMFFKDKTFIVRSSAPHKINEKSMDASRQMMSNEEQLEDMRQELVQQYEEHQQATELLRQAHMRHMEQLQEEIKRLNRQLAQRSSLNNENLVSEGERMLLEELEALKQLSLAGREKLCCELRSSSTQTQLQQEVKDWSASHAELSEQIKTFEKFQKDLLVALNHKDDTINGQWMDFYLVLNGLLRHLGIPLPVVKRPNPGCGPAHMNSSSRSSSPAKVMDEGKGTLHGPPYGTPDGMASTTSLLVWTAISAQWAFWAMANSSTIWYDDLNNSD
ncbi:A-kinase anchor protein 9-like [Callospermophilus lateralis]|uniref:A-kinase anchor protein 9-like n=1 Tax=Callospermophilus lateralis TaxID=76772 RepID=UPI00405389FD